MLFVTTSNGVYCLDTTHQTVKRLLGKKHSHGFFKPRSRGYFGIAWHSPTSRVLVASREIDDTFLSKLVTKSTLLTIDPNTLHANTLVTLDDVHDVHQITCHTGYVLLTDTGKNRLIVFDPVTGQRLVANIGHQRQDTNHINAVVVHDNTLYLGLNNHGTVPAAILHMPFRDFLNEAKNKDIDLAVQADRIQLGSAQHTHDLEPTPEGKLLSCKSHDGAIFEVTTRHDWLVLGGWTRGLAFSPEGLWVGNSEFADKKQRHNEKFDGSVSLYAWPEPICKEHIVLRGAGQVNDLLYVEDS